MGDYYLDQIDQRDRAGLDLSDAEVGYRAVHWLLWDVCNGGFRQYFYNYTGDAAMDALRMLRLIGEMGKEPADALQAALSVLPSPFEQDNAKRQLQHDRLTDSDIDRLYQLDYVIFDYKTDIEIELYEWASDHESLFPAP